jgi:hypothetical protein
VIPYKNIVKWKIKVPQKKITIVFLRIREVGMGVSKSYLNDLFHSQLDLLVQVSRLRRREDLKYVINYGTPPKYQVLHQRLNNHLLKHQLAKTSID